MSSLLTNLKKRLLLFFVVVGPGLITAVADNDAGGVATYTVAAAMYGMASQYFIIPTTILLAVSQEVGARISIVSGKGLGGLIRERYGIKISVLIFGLYLIVNQGVVLQNISGLKAALQLFNLPWQLALVAICLLLVLAVIKLSFKTLQKIFLGMILFYFTYFISAWLVHPDWAEAVRESFVFPRKINVWDINYWFSLIAVLGTTITAWGQFFVSSYIVDKGLTPKELPQEKVEIATGAIITNLFSWLIAIAVTYTLFANKIEVLDGYTAALAIKPLAGAFSSALFAVGLFGASLLGLTIVPLATTYIFTELFGFERTLDADFAKGRNFYIFFGCQILLAVVAVLFPQINLFKLTLYADYLNGAMLPIIFYFLIRFSESKNVMGEAYVSRGFTSWFIRISAVLITLAVAATFVGKVFFQLGS